MPGLQRTSSQPSPAPARPARDRPFSHHAIMRLVPPFSRRGYSVDLAASDRRQRELVFRPTTLAAVPGRHPALRCELRLEERYRGMFRLTRTIAAAEGLTATVATDGENPAALLQTLEQFEPARQFRTVSGALLARSYRIESSAGAARQVVSRVVARLTRAEARLGGIALLVAGEEGRALEVRLTADDRGSLEITEDFLAVLGWRWRPLRRNEAAVWCGSVKPPGREPQRTAQLEAMLDKAVAHLVETLARAPAEFHGRHKRARWRAAFQRLLPLLLVSGMVIAFVVLVTVLPKTQLVHMLMVHMPIVAIVAMSLLDKSYRMEIPPMPRPLTQTQWWSLMRGASSAEIA